MKKIHILISEKFKVLNFLTIMLMLFLLFPKNSLAQDPYQLEWSNEYYTAGLNRAKFIKQDSEGNIIVGGDTNENGNFDFLVLKYTPGGILLWSQVITLPSEISDTATSFFIDLNDNIFIGGVSEENFNPTTKSVIVKLNTNGDILWIHEYSNDFIASEPFNIIGDNLGNTFVTGTVDNIFPIKMVVYKLDANGNLSWDVNYGPDSSTVYYGWNLRIIDDTIFAVGVSSIGSDKKLILLKFNLNGALIYTNETFLDSSGVDVSSHIDAEGNLYIGLFGDYKVIKFDSLGNEVWQFGLPTNLPDNVTADKVNDIITDADGNVYIAGRHYGENYDDPDNYTNADLQVFKISSEGDELYSYRYENLSTNTAEDAYKLYLGYNGYLAIGGLSGASADSEAEFLAIVLDELGEPIDIIKDYEAGRDNAINSIILDEYLNLYVTGDANFKAKTQKYLFTGELGNPNFTAVENSIAPYPNPFSNSLEIETTILSGLVHFTIYNSNGSIISKSSFMNGDKETINTSSLPSGFYFYTIINGEINKSGKLIKK